MMHQTLMNSESYKYHCLTKHTLQGLFANDHVLDWNNQPNPFRQYKDCTRHQLPLKFDCPADSCADLFRNITDSGGSLSNKIGEPVNVQSISALLYFSMAISAWKQIRGTEHKWALRVNPSSGNLHPTEAHLLIAGAEDLPNGIYHYLSKDHSLELRGTTDGGSTSPAIFLCLSSIFWREAWKYRKRAFRYCNHDIGHAMAALRLSCTLLGWSCNFIGQFDDEAVSRAFGLEETDERPLLLISINGGSLESIPAAFNGQPNSLSSIQIDYPEIEAVYAATRKLIVPTEPINLANNRNPIKSADAKTGEGTAFELSPAVFDAMASRPAASIIRSRRSAVDLDGKQHMSWLDLSCILAAMHARITSDYWAPGLIHTFLYIHRVDGIERGAYRYEPSTHELQGVRAGDQRQPAKFGSCLQDIAADGCFAVSMVADLAELQRRFGDRGYRYAHHLAGFMGQMIYIGAHALGYDSTGIGCFIDDEINRYLGLAEGFEVVYNFTVGKAVIDPRLTDLAAYDVSA